MKCGHCHKDHETVAQVRSCASATSGLAIPVNINAHRPNRYAGKCKLCAGWVEEQVGHIEKVNGKYAVFHNSGDCAQKLPSVADWNEGIPAQAKQGYPDVPAGHYAVRSLTGANDLDFFRVDRPEDGTWAGVTFVKRIVGGHPDSRVRGAKNIRKALEAILEAGPEAASFLYGQELGRCWKCNRHLTDETSRALSIGPDCRSRQP